MACILLGKCTVQPTAPPTRLSKYVVITPNVFELNAGKKISNPSLLWKRFLIGAVPLTVANDVNVTLVSGKGEVGFVLKLKVPFRLTPVDNVVNDDKSIDDI